MMTDNNSPQVCDYEGSDYQTSFWDNSNRAYEDQVEAIALQKLLPPKGKMMLELGAGAGRNTPRYHGFERTVLVDYSLTQLQQARERLGDNGRYTYVCANIYHLPLGQGIFDAATMIRTLHHMQDAPRVLNEIRACLQDDAVFILEYANKQNLKAILRYLLRRQNWSPFSAEPVEFVRLNFDFHPATIRKWLDENHFSIEKQVTVSHYRSNLLKRLLPLNLLILMDRFAQTTGDLWQLSPSVFVKSHACGETRQSIPGSFFRCPKCGQEPLPDTPPELTCPNCKATFQVINGIYDLRA